MLKHSFKAGFAVALVTCLLISGCARAPKKVSRPTSVSQPTVFTGTVISSGFYHTVERGQTVYRIAKNYGVDWHELMRVNRISNPSSLEVGQQLLIPKAPPQAGFEPVSRGPLGYDSVRRLVGAPRTKRKYCLGPRW